MPRLILSSKSPRRKELLSSLGFEYEIFAKDVDETTSEKPSQAVKTLALRKANAVADGFDDAWILSADTLVSLDDKALGKPESEEDAKSMLLSLSGRSHSVFTGVCLMNAKDKKYILECVESKVEFLPLTEKDILDYIATGEPMDKAGAYAIQGIAKKFISGYTGSYTNIVGFPTETFQKMYAQALREFDGGNQ